jgi:2-amino-4-hydroxy-6-hydroxymethyldihydropteridine diphosphokinase
MGNTDILRHLNSLINDNEAIISIGSNWGNLYQNCSDALNELSKICTIVKISETLITDPKIYLNQPYFLNLIVKIDCQNLSPHQLLNELKLIEQKLNRKNIIQKGPRTMDLDIIAFKKQEIADETLTIPHPAIYSRDYLQALIINFPCN